MTQPADLNLNELVLIGFVTVIVRGKAVDKSASRPVGPRLFVHGFGLFKRDTFFGSVDGRDVVNERLCAIVPPSVVFPEGVDALACHRQSFERKLIALRLPHFWSAGLVQSLKHGRNVTPNPRGWSPKWNRLSRESEVRRMVDEHWLAGFRHTVGDFQRRQKGTGHVVSVKVRVESGCFHREHSPEAYKFIDARLRRPPEHAEVIEHESGPELLLYLAVTAGALSLAKSVVELVTEIFKARAAGIKRGDRPSDPLVLIVRRVDEKNEYHEDMILRIGHTDPVDLVLIEKELNASIRDMLNRD